MCTDIVPEYSLPFSREVGERANPTLDAMRTIVVHGRKRPKIPESWKSHEVILHTNTTYSIYIPLHSVDHTCINNNNN